MREAMACWRVGVKGKEGLAWMELGGRAFFFLHWVGLAGWLVGLAAPESPPGKHLQTQPA